MLFVFFLVVACGRREQVPSFSELGGKVKWADELIQAPPSKSRESLKKFAEVLGQSAKGAGKAPVPRGSLKVVQENFGSVYLSAVSEIGGVPREQGEDVVKTLVSAESQACAGISCANIFGVSEKGVPQFFDELLDRAGSNKTLAEPQNAAKRKTILGSLIPDEALRHPVQAKDLIARIYLLNPRPTPSEKFPIDGILSGREIKQKTGLNFVSYMSDYTTKGEYRGIRLVESTPKEDLLKTGMHRSEIDKMLKKSEVINDGLKKLPIFGNTVYRGLKGLSEEQIAHWIGAWKSRRPLGLGPHDVPATSSASWNIYTATGFISSHLLMSGRTDRYAVVLEITSHRGVAIQNVSGFPNEYEVLLPRDQRVMIEAIAPLEGAPRTFLIKMRGLDSAGLHVQTDLFFGRVA